MRGLIALVAVLTLACVAAGASAGGATAGAVTGYDVSYPQCNTALPTPGAFSIVGVNSGKPFGANPCLGAGTSPSELKWAGMNAILYANTADPGPALSTHWPNGQSSPKICDATNNSTTDCAYDYGWNAAADSYADAVNAYVSLGWAAPGATRTPVANQWWLDVESANSWLSNTAMNIADLQGAADYLSSVGASGVGFYANASDWQSITGGTTAFSAYPSWTPGAGSLSTAQSGCASAGVTGGAVLLSQYASGSFDGDVQCGAASPALSLSASQTITAGTTSAPITVSVPQPAASSITVSLSSTSSAGRLATSSDASAGTATLSVTIPAGAQSASFYYYDTKAGTPTLTASASGYATATQTESVSAAALAKLTISPNPVSVRSGRNVNLSASGTDSYGNSVSVSPTWSVTPSLGSFSAQSSATTTFHASTVGTGTISAQSGGVTGTVPVSVTGKHG